MKIPSLLAASIVLFAFAGAAIAAPATPPAPPASEDRNPANNDTYTPGEIVQKGADFFGVATETMAKAVEKVFSRYGQPNAYIAGNEGSGAIVVGLRYGEGNLYMKRSGERATRVFWQGPSIGFDLGANASKSFTLVYNLPGPESIFQRYPGVDGSYYFIAGIGVNYQQNGRIVLAPMRTGVGLRAGVNAGYLSYSRERNYLPF